MGTEEPPEPWPFRFSRNPNHESRDTAFTLFFPRFPTISRYFPVFPGPPTPPPVKGPRAVRIGNTAGRVFTRHESRPLWPFSSPWMRRAEKKRSERWLNQKPKSAARQLLSCALWCGMGRLWCGMGGRRLPFRQHGLLGFHQPRDTQHGFSLSLRRLQGEQPQPRPTGFHESRDTNHESRPFFACFDLRMVRHAG